MGCQCRCGKGKLVVGVVMRRVSRLLGVNEGGRVVKEVKGRVWVGSVVR